MSVRDDRDRHVITMIATKIIFEIVLAYVRDGNALNGFAWVFKVSCGAREGVRAIEASNLDYRLAEGPGEH